MQFRRLRKFSLPQKSMCYACVAEGRRSKPLDGRNTEHDDTARKGGQSHTVTVNSDTCQQRQLLGLSVAETEIKRKGVENGCWLLSHHKEAQVYSYPVGGRVEDGCKSRSKATSVHGWTVH